MKKGLFDIELMQCIISIHYFTFSIGVQAMKKSIKGIGLLVNAMTYIS